MSTHVVSSARPPRVVLITDRAHPRGLVEPVLAALAPFSRLTEVHVQLRAPGADAHVLVEAARALRPRTRALGVALLVNGRIDVAIASEADGVHLGERGVDARDVWTLMPHAIVSRACHDLAGVERDDASYGLLSPVGVVPGKNPPLGVEGLRAIVAQTKRPIVALGGITLDDVSDVISTGAVGIAVIRDVLHAADPGRRLQQLLSAIAASQR